MQTRRATVWLRLGPDHPVLRGAGIRVAGDYPVLVSGGAVEELERHGRVEASPGALLFGVVLHGREEPHGVDVRPFRSAIPLERYEALNKAQGVGIAFVLFVGCCSGVTMEWAQAIDVHWPV